MFVLNYKNKVVLLAEWTQYDQKKIVKLLENKILATKIRRDELV